MVVVCCRLSVDSTPYSKLPTPNSILHTPNFFLPTPTFFTILAFPKTKTCRVVGNYYAFSCIDYGNLIHLFFVLWNLTFSLNHLLVLLILY
ncbi:hypothetical protein EQG68_09540 [Flavobacterium piscinae]|uniref:Uncharacterized protein n=1 Tax=Flavobacterium piscinae TaxID=2506424 RepID=A0A4Q1KR96_9FLAO|nr:hypothetical protein EQG68_09540 [Flavobacterium piscinae]